MINIQMREGTAQALYTLILHGVDVNSELWGRVSDLFASLTDSGIFSSSAPNYEDEGDNINMWDGIPRFSGKNMTIVEG